MPQKPPLPLGSQDDAGDGADNRQMSLPFDANVVIAKSDGAQAAVLRTSTMAGDAAKPLTGNTALTATLIQSLPAAGFTVGTDTRVNAAGTTYRWTAFKSAAANLKVGTYLGDGAASKPITGVGFSPETRSFSRRVPPRPIRRWPACREASTSTPVRASPTGFWARWPMASRWATARR
ncbi:MAG: hypothetical protein H0U25_08950 [Thermoleophilaceae bacterium]|nr:hypothetical protein [Thermoleophilaceae bacterium]